MSHRVLDFTTSIFCSVGCWMCFGLSTSRLSTIITMTNLLPACFILVVFLVCATAKVAYALSSLPTRGRRTSCRRRDFLATVVTTAGTTASVLQYPAIAAAQGEPNINNDELISVYFGCGCFWHVHHEMVQAERRILGRVENTQITARAGYAGGNENNKVCYHNAAQIADYGALGHAEVVQVTLPASKFPDFCLEYCNLFTQQGYRPDQLGDTGPEYRNLVGVPGGVTSPYTKQLIAASSSPLGGDKLDFAKGSGSTDPDRRALCFVMDSNQFPFHVAEQYHQFHDGFNWGENYPQSYNNLASVLAKEGLLEKSDCPNGLIGIGALGL